MTQTEPESSPVERVVGPGAVWKNKEEHVLPENKLGIVFFGLMCARFLALLDYAIMATALPTIVAKLGGGNSYSWVGTAYMLAAVAFGPLYGKLSNMFGRKQILYWSIFIFLLGSATCGAAQSMAWLIVCRAVQGIGSGGIIQLVNITVSDIVPLKDRGRYGGILSAAWAVASIAGPILGGVITEHISWRWCFFINLPTGGVAVICLFVFLNLNPHQGYPIRDQLAEFDFIGLVCLVGGVVCLLIGLGFSQTSWSDVKTITLLVIGIVLLISGGINETLTKRSAILPARLFKTRTTGIILISAFSHGIIFYGISYFLPLFFQVLGASPTVAGIKMLVFLFGAATMSIVCGLILSETGKYRPIIWIACMMMTVGMSLMTMLNYKSSLATQQVFPLITVLGIGPLFEVQQVALLAAMPLKDMATATSAYLFLRTIGGTIGITVGEAVIGSVLPQKLANMPDFTGLGLGTTAAELLNSVGKIHQIPDVALRDAVLQAWSQAFSTIWILFTIIAGCVLILVLFLREYTLERKTVRSSEARVPGEVEQCKNVAEGPIH